MTLLADGSPWVEALGWTLLHFLWQGVVVGGVFALVRASIPKHSCNARYVNGLIALASMAIMPVATFFTLLSHQAAQMQMSPSADLADDAMPVLIGGAADSMAVSPLDGVLPWIVGVWLLGVVVVGLHSWRQWRTLAQVARRWAEPDAELQQIVAALARRFDFVRQISVLVSDRIDTPTLIGWLKPVILLPTAVAIGFPRQQVELILAHELGHLRRYDHVVNLAQAILETLLFYHPIVHWIAREVRNEREICCDTLVLRLTASEPREYAQTLAALEELRQPPMRLALAANGGVLLERVRRILFAQHPVANQVGRRMWLPAILTVAVALTVTVGVNRPDAVQFDGPLLMPDGLSQSTALPWVVPDIGSTQQLARPKFTVIEPIRASASPVAERAPSIAPPLKPAMPAPFAPIVQTPVQMQLQPQQPAVADLSHASQLAVADIGMPKPAAQAVQAAPPPKRMTPVATRTSAPEYPLSARAGQRARVELRFSIGPNGAVRNIGVVSEPADAAFAQAAKRALEQWRFDPATVVADGKAHYRQAFVFAPQGLAEAGQEANGCVRRTGSQLCQRSENAEIPAIRGDADKQVAATDLSADVHASVDAAPDSRRDDGFAGAQDPGSAP